MLDHPSLQYRQFVRNQHKVSFAQNDIHEIHCISSIMFLTLEMPGIFEMSSALWITLSAEITEHHRKYEENIFNFVVIPEAADGLRIARCQVIRGNGDDRIRVLYRHIIFKHIEAETKLTDDIFKRSFFNENVWISIKISLKFVPKGPINNILALFQIMAWRHWGGKPLSEPMMVSVPTHICVTWPQWVNHRESGDD